MTRSSSARGMLAALCLLATAAPLAAATYYVDSISGSDTNAGISSAAPWQSLAKVNTITFAPGDSILFARGRVWGGQLKPAGSGTVGSPIRIDAYGTSTDPLPIINGGGVIPATIHLVNQDYWEIANLEITNRQPLLFGVLVDANDGNQHKHIRLLGLTIHNVEGNSRLDSRESGGIQIDVDGQNTRWDDVVIDGCHIYDVGRTGIVGPYNTNDGVDATGAPVGTSWENRTPTDNMYWTPSTNVIIQNNVISDCVGNGLIWRNSDRPMIRNNLLSNNATGISGNALFVFNTDDAIIQENETYGTVYNAGDTDAAGLDIDYKNKRTILQYNYAHDNGQGGITVTAGDVAFNVGSVIRYNIFQNNKLRGMHFSGLIQNAQVYNNTVHIGAGLADPVTILNFKNWNGWPNGSKFYNNIIANYSAGANYVFGSSTNNVFDYNLLFNPNGVATNEPADSHKVTSDPLLLAPGTAGLGLDSVNGYALRSGSPALGTGLNLAANGNADYWGNYVSDTGAPNRGAYNGSAVGIVEIESMTRSSSGATTTVISDSDAGGGSYVRLNSDGTGDYVEFTGSIAAGVYELHLRYKGYTNRGQHSVSVDGVAVGGMIEQYNASSVFATAVVGRVSVATTGSHTVRLTVTGKHASATDYQITADQVMLVPIAAVSLEAENTTWASVGATTQVVNDINMSGGKWIHLGADGTGDSFEFATRRMPAGTYRVRLDVKAFNNRGQHTVHVDGIQVGGTFDQYAASTTYATIDCGTVTLTTSDLHTIKLTVNGKHGSSSGYDLSVSRIVFEPQ